MASSNNAKIKRIDKIVYRGFTYQKTFWFIIKNNAVNWVKLAIRKDL